MGWLKISKNSRPISFIGKGVCFDTGGISLKPKIYGRNEIRYGWRGYTRKDLMKTLAVRNAKVNAIGIVGLVENI